jgi:hypothetical protein
MIKSPATAIRMREICVLEKAINPFSHMNGIHLLYTCCKLRTFVRLNMSIMDMDVLLTLHTPHVCVGVGVSLASFSDPIVHCCSRTNSAIRSVAFRLSEAFQNLRSYKQEKSQVSCFCRQCRTTKQKTIILVGIQAPDFGLQAFKDLYSNFVKNRKTDSRLACQ